MEKAIKILEKTIKKCENMNSFFENELFKHNQHFTADQTEIQRIKSEKYKNENIKESCLKAIEILSKK